MSPASFEPAYSRDSRVVRLDQVTTLERLDAAWAWGGSTGRAVRVAVVDSGVELDHPALDGCAIAGVDVRIDGDDHVELLSGTHGDAYGHGTACAGIIHSLAPDSSITSIKVLDESLAGKATQFLAGLRWAVEQRFDVINLSLGTRRADVAFELHQLCDAAYFNGTVVVTAANNMTTTSYPSLFSSVISVACNTSTDPERFHYNPLPPTEFLARGIEVDVAWLGGGRTVVTGNSFAAPHVSGYVARILAKHRDLRPFQVKTVLWATASNVTEARGRAGRLSRVMAGAPVQRYSAALSVTTDTVGSRTPADRGAVSPLAPSPTTQLDSRKSV